MSKPLRDFIIDTIAAENILLKLSAPRKSKLGDYRYNFGNKTHQISVNINLSEPEFFVTFLHELAHKKCFDQFQGKVQPHGAEWKALFRDLMLDVLASVAMSEAVAKEINTAIINPKATKVIPPEKGALLVNSLSVGDVFELKAGRRFKILQKRRTRFLCVDLKSKKQYTVAGMASVHKKIEIE